jgi:hypothetical protein
MNLDILELFISKDEFILISKGVYSIYSQDLNLLSYSGLPFKPKHDYIF